MKTERTFTPGPWRFWPATPEDLASDHEQAIKEGAGDSICRPDVCAGDIQICECSNGFEKSPSFAESISNARLIAAAPDLLEACRQSFLAWSYKDLVPAKERTRAAIAKATKETP